MNINLGTLKFVAAKEHPELMSPVGKKLNVSFYPFIKAFIESSKNVPVETDMVRTSKKRGFKRQNEPSLAHSSLGLPR